MSPARMRRYVERSQASRRLRWQPGTFPLPGMTTAEVANAAAAFSALVKGGI